MKINIDFLNPKKFPLTVNQCVGIALTIMLVFSVYSITIGDNLAVYLLAMLTTGWFIFYYPEVGLIVALVITMLFERWFTLQPLIWQGVVYKIYPLDLVLFFIGLSLLWQFYLGHLRWRWHKLDTAILLFGAVCGLGFLQSFFRAGDLAVAFGAFKNYFLYAIIYVYFTLLFERAEQWERLMRWLTIGGFGLFFFLAYGLASGHGLWSEITPLSTSGERLIAGSHAFFLLLFGFWLLANYLWPNPSAPLGVSPVRLKWLMAGVVLGLLVSLVRHLWLAMAVMAVVWLIALIGLERKKLASLLVKGGGLALVGIVIVVWLGSLFSNSFSQNWSKVSYVFKERAIYSLIINRSDSSARWRLAAWQAGVSLWSTSPIIGVGMGEYINGSVDNYYFQILARELHNNYLGILLQTGFIGLAVLLYWYYYILKILVSEWKKRRAKNEFETRLLFTWGSAILLFMMVFSISVYWDINFFIIWWWVALAALRFIFVKDKV